MKMKKNRKKTILIISIVVLSIVLIEILSYKFALVQYNKPESGKGYKTFKNIGEVVKITTIDNDTTKSYLDITYPKLDDRFAFDSNKSSNQYSSYYLYESDDSYTLLASYTVGLANNYYENLLKDSSGEVSNKNKKILEKYGIENNFDVVDYIVNHYNDKVSIFSNSDSIKIHYLMNSYANSIKEGSIRYIEGDLEGFIIMSKDKTTYEVSIKKNDKLYYLSFVNGTDEDYFTEESVIKFLNSIKIEESN